MILSPIFLKEHETVRTAALNFHSPYLLAD